MIYQRCLGIIALVCTVAVGFIPQQSKADYFFIKDVAPEPQFLNPIELLQETIAEPTEEIFKVIDLMSWDRVEGTYPTPVEKYNRPHHFGRWVNDPNDQECHNTRAKVLIRDSLIEVQMSPNNKCKVSTGKWVDPYGGAEFSSARDIQIDHMVPLKHAYISGADKWDFKRRCLFANFMSNDFHLISVMGRLNMQKSDKSPDAWMPPKDDYKCEYLENWLKIKLIWGLAIHEAEAQAIRSYISTNSCALSKLALTDRLLANQRNEIIAQNEMCANVTIPPLPPVKEEPSVNHSAH